MKNRERYITKKNEYDLMINILKSGACPIRAITGERSNPINVVCKSLPEDCPECIQHWMNKEEEHGKNTQSTGRDVRR